MNSIGDTEWTNNILTAFEDVCENESNMNTLWHKAYHTVANQVAESTAIEDEAKELEIALGLLLEDIHLKITTLIEPSSKLTIQDLVDDNFQMSIIKTPIGFYTTALIKLYFIDRDCWFLLP